MHFVGVVAVALVAGFCGAVTEAFLVWVGRVPALAVRTLMLAVALAVFWVIANSGLVIPPLS